MDLLCHAYGDDVSDEEENGKSTVASSKRPKLENTPPLVGPYHQPSRKMVSVPPAEAPIPGRYISKRERAALAASTVPHSIDSSGSSTVITSPVVGSISDFDLPTHIQSSLKYKAKVLGHPRRVPQNHTVALNSHTKAVSTIQWSPTHSHLLASAGMDHAICVWNVWNQGQPKARVLRCHEAAVKDLQWSSEGLSLLSCGYDSSSRLIDVEKGTEKQVFKEDEVVTAVRFQPGNLNLFLSGSMKGSLRVWDIRVGKIVREYVRDLGPILDIEFSADARHMISSSDVSRSNLSENAIVVWDVRRQVPLSNQVYAEAFTCPCIRYHPFESSFVAQSNGNYIAIFSSRHPFKLDRYKRYEQHGVSGFPIKCNFSLDGRELASGSSDGCMYIYNYRSSELVKKIKVYDQPCIDVAFHPILPNVMASCSWSGDVSIFE